MADEVKKTNWRKWLLVGSLGLNLLFVGGLVGTALHGKDKSYRGERPPAAIGALGPMARALPDAQRAELRKAFGDRRSQFREGRRKANQADNAIIEAISADVFDREAFLAAAAQRRDVLEGISAQSFDLFADMLEKMSVEERRAYVEKAKTMRKKRGDKRLKPKGSGG